MSRHRTARVYGPHKQWAGLVLKARLALEWAMGQPCGARLLAEYVGASKGTVVAWSAGRCMPRAVEDREPVVLLAETWDEVQAHRAEIRAAWHDTTSA